MHRTMKAMIRIQKQIQIQRNSGWILMDYGDIVVHVFMREDREFYNLERIWRDGKVVFDD